MAFPLATEPSHHIPPPNDPEQIAYSVGRTAEVMDLSADVIYDLIRTGQLRSVKVGRRRLIARSELVRLITEGAELRDSWRGAPSPPWCSPG
jgi:excisionase family DNA binding protein